MAEDLEEALQRAREGDNAAVEILYRGFAGPLLSYLSTQVRRREDAEDLLGEVFVSVMRGLRSFEGDIGGFRGWLYRIATNRAVDYGRRATRRPEAPLEQVESDPAEADTEEEAIAREERARLWEAVLALPEDQRRVISLRLSGGLTSSEIAGIVGKRLGAVKALQHRALVNLTKALSPYPEHAMGRFVDEE